MTHPDDLPLGLPVDRPATDRPADDPDPVDLTRDPDWDDVPPELAALEGQQVDDGDGAGTLVIVPGLFGHVRRLREGFYDDHHDDHHDNDDQEDR